MQSSNTSFLALESRKISRLIKQLNFATIRTCSYSFPAIHHLQMLITGHTNSGKTEFLVLNTGKNMFQKL